MSRDFSEPPDKDLWSLQRGATYFVTFIYRDEAGAVRQREYNTAHPELLRANRRQLLLHSTGSVNAFELACFIPGGARIDEQGNVRAGWFRTLWCLIPLVYLLLMPLWLPLLILSGKFDLG